MFQSKLSIYGLCKAKRIVIADESNILIENETLQGLEHLLYICFYFMSLIKSPGEQHDLVNNIKCSSEIRKIYQFITTHNFVYVVFMAC